MARCLLCVFVVTCLLATQVLADRETRGGGGGSAGKNALSIVDSDSADSSSDISSFQLQRNKRHSGSGKTFIPTREWQTLEEGQSVPRGIHVRLNLETGQREAKLLDDKEDKPRVHNSLEGLPTEDYKMDHLKDSLLQAMKDLEEESAVSKEETEKEKHGSTIDGTKIFTRDELKNALKKLKASKDDVQKEPLEDDEEKTKFRSMGQIQKEFKDMGLDVKTDLEIIKDILRRYNATDLDEDTRVSMLTDLEYYVHQIDNAVNFADMGGIRLVIKDLNSTSDVVRSEAAFVLASAVQSNPKVQISAIDDGAMQQLIRMLSIEQSTAVRARVLTALSSLVRHFPFAQLKLLQLGGMQSLSDLLADPSSASKLSIKAVTLVNDLLVEKILVQEKEDRVSEEHQEMVRQYSRVSLLESVIDLGWCEKVLRLLALPEHDAREKVLDAMVTLRTSCRDHFVNASVALHTLRHTYAQLSEQEALSTGGAETDEDMYFQGFLRNIDSILGDLDVGSVREDL